MSNNVTPTVKQRAVVNILVENGGNSIPMSKAMILAGYSPATAKTPQKLTESKGFQLLLIEAGLSNHRLAQTLSDGLDANRGDTGIPDYGVRHKYLETALRLKGYVSKSSSRDGNILNSYLQHNDLDSNASENKTLVESILDILMSYSKK